MKRILKDLLRPMARRVGLAASKGAWDALGNRPWLAPNDADQPRSCNICHWSGTDFDGPFHCESAACPRCGSIARDRFLLHCFLSRCSYREGLRVVETSPRLGMPYRRMMRRYFDYTASDFDLSAHEGDIHLDLQDIRLPSDSLDILLTPHVLEHVPDTDSALSEIFRVLDSGGRMYLQVPLCLGKTRVPPTPEFHADNTEVFYNFGWDLTDRLRSAGFTVRVLVTEEFFELLSGHTAPASPGDGQFDLHSLWKECRVADLEVVADRDRSERFGFLPSHQYVTWECIKPAR